MRRLLILLGLAFALQGGAFADTLTLLDGKVITGTFLGGDARTLRMEVNNKIEMFPISEVESLRFGSSLMGAAPPVKIDPKKAKEEEKARKKAEEQAAKMAKEAEKAKQEADKAAAKAEEAAAKVKGASAAVKAPTQAPKVGRFGKPAALGRAGDAASAAKAAPGSAGGAAQTAEKVSATANQAVSAANQAASVAADPAAAAGGAAQQAAGAAASQAIGPVAPIVSNAQAVESTVGAARSVAQTASNTVDSGRAGAGRTAAAPSSAGTASHSPGTSSASHAQPGSAAPSAATTPPASAPSAPVAAQPSSSTTATPTAAVPVSPATGAAQPLEREQLESAAVPTGVVFRVRMVEAINTDIHHPGEVFRASLEAPLVSGGVPVPKGADVMLRIVKLPPARGSGAPLFSLEAISLRVDFRNLPFAAELMTQPGDALRGGPGATGAQVFRGAEAIRIPSDGLVSLRTIRPTSKR